MTKNQIENPQKTDETFVADTSRMLYELARSTTREEIVLGYTQFFRLISRFLTKHCLRLDVGWTPPDHRFYLQSDRQGMVRLYESDNRSQVPVDVSEVVDELLPPKEIVRVLIQKVSCEIKSKESIVKDLELVNRALMPFNT
jgi:hypothetical protein